jgi:tetratricopeptide (TPR) repeat protein
VARRRGPDRVTARALLLLAAAASAASNDAQTPAERFIEAGHWKRARSLVEPRIREYPNDALANFLMSQIRNAFGDQKTPMEFAEKAVALDPNTAKFHRQLAEVIGVTAQHAGVFQQLLLARRFRKEIDRALALDPRDTQALRDLMEYYLLAPGIAGGDKDRAREVAARIAAIDTVEGFLAQARLSPAQAGTFYRKAVEAQPESYKARVALAGFYLDRAHLNLDEAERHAREAARIDPGRVAAYEILAQVYARRADWDGLESLLEISDREVPDDLTPRYRAARVLLEEGKEPERAAALMQQYLSAEPEGNQPTLAEARRLLEKR